MILGDRCKIPQHFPVVNFGNPFTCLIPHHAPTYDQTKSCKKLSSYQLMIAYTISTFANDLTQIVFDISIRHLPPDFRREIFDLIRSEM